MGLSRARNTGIECKITRALRRIDRGAFPIAADSCVARDALIGQRSAPVSVVVSFVYVLDRSQPFAHRAGERDGQGAAPGWTRMRRPAKWARVPNENGVPGGQRD